MKMAYKKKRKEAEETGEEEFLAKVGKNVLFLRVIWASIWY